MTEELKSEVAPEVVPETKEEDEVKQPSEIEQRAINQGWRPREEFEGSDDEFIDAKEFVRRQPLFDKIEASTKEVKQLRKALEQFKNHYSQVKEVEYNRALTALKAERKVALENGDGDRFELIDDEIKNVEKQAQEVKQAQQTPIVQDEPAVAPEFVQWQNRNGWYNTKNYMKVYADELGTSLHQKGMAPAEVLKQVEVEVRKKFPDEFVNPRKASAPSVEEPRGTGAKRDNFVESMSPVARKIMEDLVRSGTLTREEYIADYKKIHGIK